MAQSLELIWKIYNFVKTLLGLVEPVEEWKARRQRLYVSFLYLSVVFFNLSFWYAFYSIDNLFLKIQNGIFAITCPVASIAIFLPLQHKVDYETCLRWCETLHFKLDQSVNFAKCKESSTKFFMFFVCGVPIGSISLFLSQSIIFSVMKLELSSPYLTPSPFGSGFGMIPVCFFQYSGTSYIITCLGIVYGFIFLLMQHFIAILKHMEEILAPLTSTIAPQKFHEAMKDVVDMHCQMIHFQNLLAHFSFIPILILEIMNYGLFLLIWVTIFFINDLAFLAIAASGNVLPYFLLCWMSETLVDGYQDFKEALYDLEWYKMTVTQQKMLLVVMLVVEHPKLLRAGPFHEINYSSLADVLNRVYSLGLVINNATGL